MNESSSFIFLLPVIAALLVGLLILLRSRCYFHPQDPKKILGLTFRSLPKRQKQIALKTGELVANELFSIKDVVQKLRNYLPALMHWKKLGKESKKPSEKNCGCISMLSMFLSDEMIEKVTKLFQSELEDFLRVSAQGLAAKVEDSVDIKSLVEEKVRCFSSNKIEVLLLSFMEQEFRFIEKIGAVLGLIIGCIQVLLLTAF